MASNYPSIPDRGVCSIDYQQELNEQQLKAVTSSGGQSLVIAGAGSGKTRTLTYRVAYLVEQKVRPFQILLLTFTNKAAREMMGRACDLVGEQAQSLWGGTFHSIGNRILRREASLVGYPQNYTIMDRSDTKKLLTECIKDEKIDTKALRFPKSQVLANLFSERSNRLNQNGSLESRATFLERNYDPDTDLYRKILAVWRRYEKRKLEGALMDFDDLLIHWLEIFEQHERIRSRWQRKFQFVLVDEYQDTNQLQSRLIDMLAQEHGNLMVVGDDAQCIYEWRGAEFRNIIDFPKRFPKTQIYRIEYNYRSVPEILNLANEVIAQNREQFAKNLRPVRDPGPKPLVVKCRDTNEQAMYLAQQVMELQKKGVSLNDMAVLYRAHSHSMELEMELRQQGINYVTLSGVRFFEQAHIKDVIAYLKLRNSDIDELSFKRLTTMLPHIGGKTADKLWEAFSQQANDARTASASEGEATAKVAEYLANCSKLVTKKAKAAWAAFCATGAQLESPEVRDDPESLIELILKTGFEKYVSLAYENAAERLEDVGRLADYIAQYDDIDSFLEEMALQSNLESEEAHRPSESAQEKQRDYLRLTTVHQAKGLEFKVVFVIMLYDGAFPLLTSHDFDLSGEEYENRLEEECRIFYVAVTRAKDRLYLCYPEEYFDRSLQQYSLAEISRFVSEISSETYDSVDLSRGNSPF